jgi:hypothetical protein
MMGLEILGNTPPDSFMRRSMHESQIPLSQDVFPRGMHGHKELSGIIDAQGSSTHFHIRRENHEFPDQPVA